MQKLLALFAIPLIICSSLAACSKPEPPLPSRIAAPTSTTTRTTTPAPKATTPLTTTTTAQAPTQNGTIEVRVSAASATDHVWVTLQDVQVMNPYNVWLPVTGSAPAFDLKAVQENEQLLCRGQYPGIPYKYQEVRFWIKTVTVDSGGTTANASTPSYRIELVHDFRVEPNKTTVITLEFDAEKSLTFINGKLTFDPWMNLLITRPAKPGETVPPVISTITLPYLQVGMDFSATLRAAGGKKPYTWSTDPEYLPAGLTLDPSGNITGNPLVQGYFEVPIMVADSSTPPLTDIQFIQFNIIY
jgi:hypothetical protein